MIVTVIVPVVLNIINRSVLNKYSISLEATALLAYVWIGYGFFGYLYRKDAHVDVKFIVNKMPPRCGCSLTCCGICLSCCSLPIWFTGAISSLAAI